MAPEDNPTIIDLAAAGGIVESTLQIAANHQVAAVELRIIEKGEVIQRLLLAPGNASRVAAGILAAVEAISSGERP